MTVSQVNENVSTSNKLTQLPPIGGRLCCIEPIQHASNERTRALGFHEHSMVSVHHQHLDLSMQLFFQPLAQWAVAGQIIKQLLFFFA